jgi:hypothetical protein
MNEEQLAGALAKHLDALLVGEPLPEPPPEEIASLLAMAEGLEELAPKPRPEFSAALRESLLNSSYGAGGTPTATGGSVPPWGPLAFIVIAALGVITALTLLGGGMMWQTFGADDPALPPDDAPVESEMEQAQPTLFPVTPSPLPVPATATSTTTPGSSPTLTVTSSPVPASPTATFVIDVLPPITATATLEANTEEVPLPPALVPGSPSGSSDSGNGGSSGGGSGGSDDDDDGNRGHGNDSDGHDEDNPGRGRD